MQHKFEYQLTIVCDDPECTGYGDEVCDLASDELDDISRLADKFMAKHEADEEEFNEWEDQQKRVTGKEDF